MSETRAVSKLNVVLIMVDAVRSDHLSCYGYHRNTSPRIDQIAAEGCLFLNAIAPAPGTLSSVPSILTGRYVSEHGVGPLNPWLDVGFVTLAEWLRQRGYLTAAFSNNAWVSEATNLSSGFSTFRQISRLFPHGRKLSRRHVWAERLYRLFVSERYDLGDRRVIEESIKWIEAASKSGSPCFLFVHLLEAHAPYDPPNPYYGMFLPKGVKVRRRSFPRRVAKRIRGRSPDFHAVPKTECEQEEIVALYDASIRYLDDLIGGFYAKLDALGILEDTLYIITADHGENLGDHGLLGHGGCLYETLIHVPLICVHRDYFAPSERVQSLVQTHDIFPTVVDLLGGDEALGFDCGRRSLALHRVQEYPRSAVFSEDPRYGTEHLINTGLDPDVYDRALSALRTYRWKYIQGTDGSEELYDLENDPNEQKNLARVETQRALELQEHLSGWKAGLQVFDRQARHADVDEVIVERLRGLGYLD